MLRSQAAMLGLLAAVLLPAMPVLAQSPGSFNWPYNLVLASDDGLSLNEVDDARARLQLVRVTPGVWLRSPERHPWGLRLKVPATFGVNELTLLEGAVEDSIRAFALVPGLEAWIPLGRMVTLRPAAGIGWGRTLEGPDDAFLLELGGKVDVEPEAGAWRFLIRPEVRYELSRTRSGRGDDEVGTLALTLDVLRPLPLDFGGTVPNVSTYVQTSYFFEEALLQGPGPTPLSIDRQYEVGLSVGSEPRLRIGFIRLNRLHIGYRWGDGLSGIRIRLGSR